MIQIKSGAKIKPALPKWRSALTSAAGSEWRTGAPNQAMLS